MEELTASEVKLYVSSILVWEAFTSQSLRGSLSGGELGSMSSRGRLLYGVSKPALTYMKIMQVFLFPPFSLLKNEARG